jgi:hypothetical protein
LTLDEVIARAYELYPNRIVTPTAARTWVARDMLPAPTIQSFGRGKGTRAHYPVDAAAQMATAGYMMDRWGYTQKQIALARRVVLEKLSIDDAIRVAETGQLHDEAIRMINASRVYAAALARAKAGGMLGGSAEPGSIKHKWQVSPHTTPSGKLLYHCPVCGLYDPAPVKAKFENRECKPGAYEGWWEVMPRQDGNGSVVRVKC